VTPLGRQLAAEIAASGPITVERYMAACVQAYYASRDPFGGGGDFITAPEISQMFGELIGAWLADLWLRAGSPPVRLVELGPGRGTLMADALRAANHAPGFGESAEVHFVETSPALRAAQSERVPQANWHERLEDVPADRPLLLVANEFFDALPVRQYVRSGGGWRERRVEIAGPAFRFAEGDPLPLDIEAEDGAILEKSPARAALAAEIGARLAARGGAALIVDYGYAGPATGDTLQALARHQPADLLAAPGEADLTAHVDFGALAEAARAAGALASPLVSQGRFLAALGIAQRAETLQRGLDPEARPMVAAQMRRLVSPQAMGELFKVLALSSCRWPIPAGFA
jgi:NADH dehydrogenase [ubiquinone] 1 alpha subcomplex assembly factor 7